MFLASVFPGEDTGVPVNGPKNSVLYHSSTSMYVIGSIIVLLGDIDITLNEASLHRRRTNQQLSKPTYLLTPRSRAPLEKLTGSAASQEIPRIFGTRRFLTVPTSARQLSLS